MPIIYRSGGSQDSSKIVIRLSGYSLEKLITFTGLDAIHTVEDVIKNGEIEIEWYNSTVTTKIETDVLLIKIAVDTNTKIVDDRFIRLKSGYERIGIGTAIFNRQQENLFNAGFKMIICRAEGNKQSLNTLLPDERFNGFITWAKAGFSMAPDSESLYNAKLANNSIPLMPLHKLIRQHKLTVYDNGVEKTMTGEEYWKEYGDFWYGEFDLNRNSDNVKRLKHYIQEKQQIMTTRRILPAKSLT